MADDELRDWSSPIENRWWGLPRETMPSDSVEESFITLRFPVFYEIEPRIAHFRNVWQPSSSIMWLAAVLLASQRSPRIGRRNSDIMRDQIAEGISHYCGVLQLDGFRTTVMDNTISVRPELGEKFINILNRDGAVGSSMFVVPREDQSARRWGLMPRIDRYNRRDYWGEIREISRSKGLVRIRLHGNSGYRTFHLDGLRVNQMSLPHRCQSVRFCEIQIQQSFDQEPRIRFRRAPLSEELRPMTRRHFEGMRSTLTEQVADLRNSSAMRGQIGKDLWDYHRSIIRPRGSMTPAERASGLLPEKWDVASAVTTALADLALTTSDANLSES